MKRAVFLDRDGTLIEEKQYLHRPDQVAFFPRAITALQRLSQADFLLFMVTNQSGVGRGYFTLGDVNAVHEHIRVALSEFGVSWAHIYVAPEAPDQPSRGRKPSPEFLFDARKEFGVDLAQSYMIGDKLIDLECGWNAGVKRSILVRTGYGREVDKVAGERLKDALVVEGLTEAADYILG
jgi:D-glycero-D-manno-heptose 1,7-bisphosphate phosphatase